jgi:hypothetical protein
VGEVKGGRARNVNKKGCRIDKVADLFSTFLAVATCCAAKRYLQLGLLNDVVTASRLSRVAEGRAL